MVLSYVGAPAWAAVDSLIVRWSLQKALDRSLFLLLVGEAFGDRKCSADAATAPLASGMRNRFEEKSSVESSASTSKKSWSAYIITQRARLEQFRFKVVRRVLNASSADLVALANRYAKPQSFWRQLALGAVRSTVKMGAVWLLLRYLPQNNVTASMGQLLWGKAYNRNAVTGPENHHGAVIRYLLLDSFLPLCIFPHFLHRFLAIGQISQGTSPETAAHFAETVTRDHLNEFFVTGSAVDLIWESTFFCGQLIAYKVKLWRNSRSDKPNEAKRPKRPRVYHLVGVGLSILMKYHYITSRLGTFLWFRDFVLGILTRQIANSKATLHVEVSVFEGVRRGFINVIPIIAAVFALGGLIQYNLTQWLCNTCVSLISPSVLTRDLPFPHPPAASSLSSLASSAEEHAQVEQVGLLRSVHWCHLRSFAGVSLVELEFQRRQIVALVREALQKHPQSFTLDCDLNTTDRPITNDAIVHAMLHCFKINNFVSRVAKHRDEQAGFEKDCDEHLEAMVSRVQTQRERTELRDQLRSEHGQLFDRSSALQRLLAKEEVFDFNPRRMQVNDKEVRERHCCNCSARPFDEEEKAQEDGTRRKVPADSKKLLAQLPCEHYVCETCLREHLRDACPQCCRNLENIPEAEAAEMEERADKEAKSLLNRWTEDSSAFLPDELRYCVFAEAIDFIMNQCEQHAQVANPDDSFFAPNTTNSSKRAPQAAARLGSSGAGSPFELLTANVPHEYKRSIFAPVAYDNRCTVAGTSSWGIEAQKWILDYCGFDPL